MQGLARGNLKGGGMEELPYLWHNNLIEEHGAHERNHAMPDDHEETRTMFTVTETAARLGVTRRTIARAIERGTLPATPCGTFWLVATSDADAYRRVEGETRGRRKGKPAATPPEKLPMRKREHYALMRAQARTPRALVDVLDDAPEVEPVGRFVDLATVPEEMELAPELAPAPMFLPPATVPEVSALTTESATHRLKQLPIRLRRGNGGAWVQVTQNGGERRAGARQSAEWEAGGRVIERDYSDPPG